LKIHHSTGHKRATLDNTLQAKTYIVESTWWERIRDRKSYCFQGLCMDMIRRDEEMEKDKPLKG
jgi:hypothetical protein